MEGLQGVVVQVVKVEDHPNSDTLTRGDLDDGTGEHVVCAGIRQLRGRRPRAVGAPGPVSACSPSHRPRELRGVMSNGMMCSLRELAIADVHTGILVLNDEGVAVGTIPSPPSGSTTRSSTSRSS